MFQLTVDTSSHHSRHPLTFPFRRAVEAGGGMVGGGWYDQILLESEEPLASVDRLRDSCLAAPPAEGGQKGGKMDGLLPALAVSCGESMLSR